MSVRVVVVDDEPLARDELCFMLEQCEDIEVVGQAADAASALQLCEQTKPDVVFADLRMPGPDGLALAEALTIRTPDTAVVMVSAHDEGATRAFEARVADYLLKPVRLERLRTAVERLRSRVSRGAPPKALDRLAVRRKNAYVVVDIKDVVYFEVRDELVWAITEDDRFALDVSLAYLEQRLEDTDFFRSHRGTLVRLDRIAAIEPTGTSTYDLVLDHPSAPRVPLARERARVLRKRIPFAG